MAKRSKKIKTDYDIDYNDWRQDDFYRCKKCNVAALVNRQDEGIIHCPRCNIETEFSILRYFNIRK